MGITPEKKLGLVLTGGGARAAYQVGVLRAIAEITGFEKNPFAIISGFSAGALNGTWLASQSENFEAVTRRMVETWSSLTAEQIFKVGPLSFTKIAYRWIRDRSSGGIKKNQITYLLDTSPLAELIKSKINFKALNENIQNNLFHAISVCATDYRTGQSVAFYNGHENINDWNILNRKSLRTLISAEHVLASSAIPIFFPPVRIGESYFGDGMVRLNSPLSAAIHLGAEKLLVIGNRRQGLPLPQTPRAASEGITLGEIVGTILSGLFLDSLDSDLERIARVNRGVAVMSAEAKASQPDHLREIPILNLAPLSEVIHAPANELSRMPMTFSYLLRGIGVSENKGSDLLSYLAFEPEYLCSLIQIGHQDTLNRKAEILKFFDL
ncbi:patatin [Bdellovibrio sp. qaytius]|nr:patatin [Bdellovibrio sp. qaytius]